MGRIKVEPITVNSKALCDYLAIGSMTDELNGMHDVFDTEFLTVKGRPKKKYQEVYDRWYSYYESKLKEYAI